MNNATLEIDGLKTLNNLNSTGKVTFNADLTLAKDKDTEISGLDGSKNVTKTGSGTTTLSGNNTVGTFVQQNGKVILDGNLTGDYQQENTAGDFVAGTTIGTETTIDGNATFNGNIELKNQLVVSKNFMLEEDAILKIDFTQNNRSTDAVIEVGEGATINDGAKAEFKIASWEAGTTPQTYKLISAAQNINGTFEKNNISITFDGKDPNNRQGVAVVATDSLNELNLITVTQNQAITRSTGGQWSDPNWNNSDTQKFYNGDHVTFFNGNGNETIKLNVDSPVETAGVNIISGKWSFNGNSITGQVQNSYGTDSLTNNNNTGNLNVTGTGTTATFDNEINFTNISVANKAKLSLIGDKPVTTETLVVDDKSKLHIQAVANKITATNDVILNGEVKFLEETDPAKNDLSKNHTIENIIKTDGTISGISSYNISDKLLASTKIEVINQNQLNLVHTTSSVGDFAASDGLPGNTVRVGELIDALKYADSKLLQELYQLEKDETEILEQILFNQLGPELAANAMQLSLWRPYLKVFNRLHDLGNLYTTNSNIHNDSEDEVRGQLKTKLNHNIWFEGYYRHENVSKDYFARQYQSERGGMLTGIESYQHQNVRAGLFFGYGKPRVYNEIGRVDANDFTLGMYSRLRFGQKLFLNAFVAYGIQDYEYRHNNYRTSYNGNAMYASVELFKPSLQKDNSQFTPLVAVDFQKAWINGFTAEDTAQKINHSKLDQIVLRMGLNSKFQPKEFVNFRTRLQYGVQVGGETYGSVRTSFLTNPSESRTLTGVNLGRNMFNAGVGFDIYSNKFKHLRLFADYDFDLGERSTAHTGHIGIVTTF
jgi:hypothetical protein